MSSHFDLVEDLSSYLQEKGLEVQERLETLKGKTVVLSGQYFLEQVVTGATGTLLSGFCEPSLVKSIADFDARMKQAEIRYRVVFDGVSLFPKTELFKNYCSTLSNFYHKLWKLEVFQCLYQESSSVEEIINYSQEIARIRTAIRSSKFQTFELNNRLQKFVINLLDDASIEYFIAPQDALRQMVWLFDHDYCQAVVGDVSCLMYSGIVPQVITHLNFSENTFTFFDSKEVETKLDLVQPNSSSRFYELWCFYSKQNTLERQNLSILGSLDSFISKVLEEHSSTKKAAVVQLGKNISKIRRCIQQSNNEAEFTRAFEKAGITNLERGRAVSWIDLRQVITGNCEFESYPSRTKVKIKDKEKLRSLMTIDFHSSKRNYAYYAFGIFDKHLLSASLKSTKYTFMLAPPTADSEEYRTAVSSFFKPSFEKVMGEVISTYSKLFYIYEYCIDCHFFKSPSKLDVKTSAKHFSDARKLHYFTQEAIEEWEKMTGKTADLSMVNILTIFFHFLNAAPESSPLQLSELVEPKTSDVSQLDKEKQKEACVVNEKEVFMFVFLQLLDNIGFISLTKQKFFILGAGLMRKGNSKFEDRSVLLLTMLMHGLVNGEFMNPPERKMLKNKKSKNDDYLMESLRKTSEEIRNKSLNIADLSEDDPLSLKSRNRLESEQLILGENDFAREVTIYDCEKSINVVAQEIAAIKKHFYSYCTQNKKLISDPVELLNNGIYDKEVQLVLLTSRFFALVNSNLTLNDTPNARYLVDFDTSQFLNIVLLFQTSLCFQTEALFFAAMFRRWKYCELEQLTEIKAKLPFKTSYSSHAANLIKVVLTRYCAARAIKKVCSEDYQAELDLWLNKKALEVEFAQFENVGEVLLEGYYFFKTNLDIIKIGVEKGIQAEGSPVIKLCIQAFQLLQECLKELLFLK